MRKMRVQKGKKKRYKGSKKGKRSKKEFAIGWKRKRKREQRRGR
jgi:hypothetical protein